MTSPTPRSAIAFLALVLFTPALLFASAGTLAWPIGWAYVALATAGTGTAHLLVAWRDTDTLEERARGFQSEGVQSWDHWVVRHPGYAGSVLATIFVPVILDSWWAFVLAGVAVVAIVVRTALEDGVLRRELDGYEAFAQHTRRRLVPGIW